MQESSSKKGPNVKRKGPIKKRAASGNAAKSRCVRVGGAGEYS